MLNIVNICLLSSHLINQCTYLHTAACEDWYKKHRNCRGKIKTVELETLYSELQCKELDAAVHKILKKLNIDSKSAIKHIQTNYLDEMP